MGRRLRRLRQARGLTQSELARPLYTHAYVSSIESGRRTPSRRALTHFAAKLGIDPDELETGRPRDLEARLQTDIQVARQAASRGHYDDADNALVAVARRALRHELPRIRARAEHARGVCLELQGNPEAAIACYQRAEDILRDHSPDTRADAVAGRARCLQMIGELHYAIYLLEKLLEELRREGLEDPTALSRIHASLVAAYFDSGQYANANASAKEALRLAPRVADPEGLSAMHMNVARVHLHENRVNQALVSLQRAEDLYRQLDFQSELASAHLARGYVYSRDGKLGRARTELALARDIFVENGSLIDEARATYELARLERLEGNPAEAERLLQRSLEILNHEEHAGVLALTYREMGHLLASEDRHRASEQLLAAIELFERIGDSAELAATYRVLGDVLLDGQDIADAAEAYRKGITALVENA